MLFSSTMFAPGNPLEESAQDVQGARCCMNGYCTACALCCLYCCYNNHNNNNQKIPDRILPETRTDHKKMI